MEVTLDIPASIPRPAPRDIGGNPERTPRIGAARPAGVAAADRPDCASSRRGPASVGQRVSGAGSGGLSMPSGAAARCSVHEPTSPSARPLPPPQLSWPSGLRPAPPSPTATSARAAARPANDCHSETLPATRFRTPSPTPPRGDIHIGPGTYQESVYVSKRLVLDGNRGGTARRPARAGRSCRARTRRARDPVRLRRRDT